MKRRKLFTTLAAVFLAVGLQAGAPPPSHAVTRISASIDFYDELTPYGSWEQVDRYGDCWVPDMPSGWRPYTQGYWVDTDYGWMWVSQDRWGGIPYHYGRWAYDRYYGWVWVPDDDLVWAPAWVSWRYGDDYVGWAPLPPDAGWGGSGLSISVSLLDRRIDRSGWCFAPVRSFGTTSLRASILPPSRNVTLIARTRNVTNYTVYNGLPAERGLRSDVIQRATGRKIQRYHIVDSPSKSRLRSPAIQGSRIVAYRPRITGVKSQRERFVPQSGTRSRGNVQRQGRPTTQQPNDVRQRQQAETRAQRDRQRQGQGQVQPPARDRGQGQSQPPARDRGQGQQRMPRDRGQVQPPRDRGQGQGQGQRQPQGQEQRPPRDRGQVQPQNPGRGRPPQEQNQRKGPPPQDQIQRKGPRSQDQIQKRGPQDQNPRQRPPQDQGKGRDQGGRDSSQNQGNGHGRGGR